MPTAQINDIDMYYEEHGAGEPLLLIMGFMGHSQAWIMQIPVLAQKYRVVVFDNRGVGRTSVPEGPYSIRQMAGDAAALLDHLQIEQAMVVGWSMGGMIAQELTLSYPEKVSRLVLLASLSRAEPYAEAWIDFHVEAAAKGLNRAGLILQGMPWGFTPSFMTQPALVQFSLQRSLADPYPPTATGIAGQAVACREFALGPDNALDRLSGISVPTLVLVGAEDILTPVALASDMAERIPNARLQVLDKGGHGMPLEYALQVNEAVLAFLAEPAAAAATA